MTIKIALYALIVPALLVAALPAAGQMPGRNTPLTDNDAQIMQLVGDSYGDTMSAIGSVYLYLLTQDPAQAAGFAPRMNQADKNLQKLKNYLLLERPANRDLHQTMDTLIAAKASLQTGAQALLTSLHATKTNNLPQKSAIFSARAEHFAYTFEALESALFKCLLLTYGAENRDLIVAEAVARLQWDSVESVALAHKFLLSGDRLAAVQFDNKITNCDGQVVRFRSNRDLTRPDQKHVAAALDTMVQKKGRFAAQARTLFQAKSMNKGVDPSMLTILKADIQAFIAAVRSVVDLAFLKAAPAGS